LYHENFEKPNSVFKKYCLGFFLYLLTGKVFKKTRQILFLLNFFEISRLLIGCVQLKNSKSEVSKNC